MFNGWPFFFQKFILKNVYVKSTIWPFLKSRFWPFSFTSSWQPCSARTPAGPPHPRARGRVRTRKRKVWKENDQNKTIDSQRCIVYIVSLQPVQIASSKIQYVAGRICRGGGLKLTGECREIERAYYIEMSTRSMQTVKSFIKCVCVCVEQR